MKMETKQSRMWFTLPDGKMNDYYIFLLCFPKILSIFKTVFILIRGENNYESQKLMSTHFLIFFFFWSSAYVLVHTSNKAQFSKCSLLLPNGRNSWVNGLTKPHQELNHFLEKKSVKHLKCSHSTVWLI